LVDLYSPLILHKQHPKTNCHTRMSEPQSVQPSTHLRLGSREREQAQGERREWRFFRSALQNKLVALYFEERAIQGVDKPLSHLPEEVFTAHQEGAEKNLDSFQATPHIPRNSGDKNRTSRENVFDFHVKLSLQILNPFTEVLESELIDVVGEFDCVEHLHVFQLFLRFCNLRK
jgi:hypothetical protein